ncbi:MAG: ABC transporter permease [Candidatus Micrarchaeota archaeon]
MKLFDIASLSISNMRSRKMRSWLTVLGIVIAVAAIIVLISLANGVSASVSSRLNQLGNDVIQITPGASRAVRTGGAGIAMPGAVGGGGGGGFSRDFGGGGFGRTLSSLTFDDADALMLVDGVSSVDARIQGTLRTTFKGKNASLQIVGVDPAAFKEMNTVELIDGKLLNPSDRYSVVLGYRIHSSTYEGEELLNRQIKMGDYSFRVVGLLNQSAGSSITSDSVVYMPIEVAKVVLNESSDVSQIFVKIASGRDADVMAAALESKLLDLHRLTPDKADFTITTASFFQSAVSDITNMLSLFLGGIAAISLLVGAIGVANTMFMSVLERIKEIGILKALGMRDSEVTALFLIEAASIGFAGGALGIALSLAISEVLRYFSVPSLITPELMVGSLVFSSIIGIVAGVAPARNASRLEPVEALRYE